MVKDKKNGAKPRKYDSTFDQDVAQNTGKRLRLIRRILDMNAREFADSLGIANNTFSHWENGHTLIPQTKALKIRALYGFTLDYLYTGDRAGLPHRLAKKISALENGGD